MDRRLRKWHTCDPSPVRDPRKCESDPGRTVSEREQLKQRMETK